MGEEKMIALFIHSILLLILAICGNFVADTFSCRTQYALRHNMYVKHAIILFMIYVFVNHNFLNEGYPHPKHSLTKSIFYLVLICIVWKNFTKLYCSNCFIAYSYLCIKKFQRLFSK